jgi:Chaperone of endosialidase
LFPLPPLAYFLFADNPPPTHLATKMGDYKASFHLSPANGSWFTDEVTNDVIIHPSAPTQKLLLGSSRDANAMLKLTSNDATVGGPLNAASVSTNLIQSTGINLSLYDPQGADKLVTVAPQFQYLSDPATSNAAYAASNTAFATSNAVFQSGSLSGSKTFGDNVTFSSNVVIGSNLTISGAILPTKNKEQVLGTRTMQFKEAWFESVHIGSNTLYIGDTPVLGTDAQTINIKADRDQGITLKTTGTGQSVVQSEQGVVVSTTGANGANVQVQATGQIMLNSSAGVRVTSQLATLDAPTVVNSNLTVKRDLRVEGDLYVEGARTEVKVSEMVVEDNIVTLNYGQTGTGGVSAASGRSGISIDLGGLGAHDLLYDNTAASWIMGRNCGVDPLSSANIDVVAGRKWATSNIYYSANQLAETASNQAFGLATVAGGSNTFGRQTVINSNLFVNGQLTVTNFVYLQSNVTLYNTQVTQSNLITGKGTFSNTVWIDNCASETTGLYVKGNIVGNGNIIGFTNTSSDRALKTDLQPVTDALSRVMAINGYTYSRLDNPGDTSRYMGVVAQEVQPVAPELVKAIPDDGHLTVAYGQMTALLIEAVKELAVRTLGSNAPAPWTQAHPAH